MSRGSIRRTLMLSAMAMVLQAIAYGAAPDAKAGNAKPPAAAKAPAANAKSGADVKGADTKSADLARIEKYMNNLRTMSTHFQQSASNGNQAEGMLYIERPGRLRVEYDPPTPVLIVSDGDQVHYFDSELKQVSTVSLSDTPANVLIRDNYKFGSDVTVSDYEKGPGTIRVTLQDPENRDAGALTLTFQDNPLVLKQWKVKDQQGIETTVTLEDPRRDVALSPKLFEFIDPTTKTQRPFGNQP